MLHYINIASGKGGPEHVRVVSVNDYSNLRPTLQEQPVLDIVGGAGDLG